jgi:hypothetical protein
MFGPVFNLTLSDFKDQSSFSVRPGYRRFLKVLILLQFINIVGIYLSVRTEYVWFWAIFSFIPALIICLTCDKKIYVLSSLLLLFISQHALFFFANPAWGYSIVHVHDSSNDFHIASIISENAHFELGQVGYGSKFYSYYPLLHIFSVTLNKISGIPLIFVARYIIPIYNAVFTPLLLYLLNFALFGLFGRTRNMAILLFAVSWFYTAFQSQFVREAFAFPLTLLSIFVVVRVIRVSNHRARAYVVISAILFTAVVLSHHFTSYILFLILALIALSLNIFYKKNRINNQLFLMGILLFCYISFVTMSLFVQQATSVYETFLLLFREKENVSIMVPYPQWRVYLAIIYYVIIGLLTLLGSVRLFYELKKRRALFAPEMFLIVFFVFSFLLFALVRMSVSASLLSWAYDMALRGTIWCFIGISIVAAIGIKYVLKICGQFRLNKIIIASLIICTLAAGKFAQYPLAISDSTVTPYITYPRYMSTSWLKGEVIVGSNLLVAPQCDLRAFEISRVMAPYSHLRGYFLDETKGFTYEKFHGYIPLIGGFFDQYNDSLDVQIIYSNGDTDIGYKK